MKNKKHCTLFHRIFYFTAHPFVWMISRWIWGYRSKARYHIKKGEKVLVLSNHQTDIDPLCILTSFNRPVYTVGTDSLFNSWMSRFFYGTTLGVIPKKKGAVDLQATSKMMQVAKEGGSLLLFPEGNRTYAEFQYFISPSFPKFVKTLGCTLILFRLEGGTGTRPRFKHKRRKGNFSGKIAQVIPYEQYKDVPDEDLLEVIKDAIKVYDSESHDMYKSPIRAEYLEREFFYCPKCGSVSTLRSEKEHFRCTNCGLDVIFTENMHFKSDDPEFKITTMLEWWNLQKIYIRSMNIAPNDVIFKDENVQLFEANAFKKRKLLNKGNMTLTDKELTFGDVKFQVKDIKYCSVISGQNISFQIENNNYLVVGHERFNPLKYAFMFNKLDTIVKEKHTDDYYNLKEDSR